MNGNCLHQMWTNAGNLLRSVDLMPSVITSPEPSAVNVRTAFSLLVMDGRVLVSLIYNIQNIHALVQIFTFKTPVFLCVSFKADNLN